ncbi:hypothetical protein VDG1235_1683 [Verrucomicrobiia bacterium DG1235]|nr:hypothetical protein VDG1235_1683 [Verrucomicrobiae bacterium DG1235]
MIRYAPLLVLLLTSSCAPVAQRPTPTALLQNHTITLSFKGPATSEDAEDNPFTDTRLLVTFTHKDSGETHTIRGFYAADGNAAETSADSGDIWQTRFAPPKLGDWSYSATLHTGPLIAIDDDPSAGEAYPLKNATSTFTVIPGPAYGPDFRDFGRLTVDRNTGYFRSQNSDTYFLKGGADSPENFLGYADFDGTYKHSLEFREGESRPTEGLHTYATHLGDWNEGDPSWQNGKGKGIIGALNYLASTGMNAVYFLTLNIDGDGKDVWPYRDHLDFTRFDCSKLDQWEIVFSHAQSLGILLHVVTQETENERLLDDGETETYRKLYYRELIARFAHHPAIVWNLGEENGPADFSPNGQTSAQQRTMASYLKTTDPYKNTVVIHTHSVDTQKDELLPPLLNHTPLDGLSFQVNEPTQVHDEIKKWIHLSREAGHRWLIAMDEIGPWQIGAAADVDDPDHDSLRHHVLWGSLMGGAAGVEWYFGAHQKGNDLDTEDWRSRANLWAQTRHALDFFETYLPYPQMQPADELTPAADDYCLALPGQIYAIYLPSNSEPPQLDLAKHSGSYTIHWFSPKNGGTLQTGDTPTINGPGLQPLGSPPSDKTSDWTILVRKTTP